MFATTRRRAPSTLPCGSQSSLPIEGSITATVTDPNGDTSEFSNAVPVTPSTPSPWTLLPPSPSSLTPPHSPPVSPPAAPATPPPSFVQAAITLFIDGAELVIDQLEGYGNANLAGLYASIAANSPYAGPFAELFVLAGETLMAEPLSAAK